MIKKIFPIIATASLLFLTVFTFQAQDTSFLVTDIRITLMDAGRSSVDPGLIRSLIYDSVFVNKVYLNIQKTVNDNYSGGEIAFEEGCLEFLFGLDSKPYHYKKMKTNRHIIVLESNIGLAEVMKQENYEIVTLVRVFDTRKKRVYRNTSSVPIDPYIDDEGYITGKFTREAFTNAYLKSLFAVFGGRIE